VAPMTDLAPISPSAPRKVASRYNISIPLRRGRRLVFNSLSMAMAVWEAEEAVAFERICDGRQDEVDAVTFNSLVYGGFIVGDDIDEVAALEQLYKQQRYDVTNTILTIAPTMACNFACDYCFQGQDKPHKTMGADVQDAIVAMVERAAPKVKQLGVTWYGGEPLLRPKVIEALSDRMIEVCARHGVPYNASIVTNGFMLTPELARSLHLRRVTWMQITLDGTPEYHDSRRYLLGGKGSFEKIIANLKAIVDEVPITIAIRVNIDDRNHQDIHGLLDHMAKEGLGHKKNLKMYFAPVEALTEGCHVVQDVTMAKSRYGELEAALYRHGWEVGLTELPFPPRFHGICGAVKPSALVILPTGELHKCWDTVSDPARAIGSIFKTEELLTSDLMKRWLDWSPFDNHSCKNCKILPNCAGACAYKFIHAESTRSEAAVLPCPSWKYNIKERLVQRAEMMGKISADDYDPAEIRTVPAELCADEVIAGGLELPENMQRLYEDQKKPRLPVVS
jgi:uncharacterized protein